MTQSAHLNMPDAELQRGMAHNTPVSDAGYGSQTIPLNETMLHEQGNRRPLGSYLLAAKAVTTDALAEALALAQRTGIRVGQALLHLQQVDETALVVSLAEQHRLAYRALDVATLNQDVARIFAERDARRWQALPVAVDARTIIVAMVDPLDHGALRDMEHVYGKTIIPTITTARALERALEALYQHEYTHRSTQEFVQRHPADSAFRVVSRAQALVLTALLAVSITWLRINPISFLIVFNTFATLFYIAFSTHRFYLIYCAMSHQLEVEASSEEVAALHDRHLPVYTILVPLYREASVLPKLSYAIRSLDYPLAKLDIKLLMEADDQETIEAARRLHLPPNFEHVIVPHSMPKTKPKACNYGLLKARGKYVVIYDAEDMPEADQLKKVVVAFRKMNERVACIQAKLNYYNRNQNLLTRWFTIEYSMWFDLFLPGLDASNTPVPLGGTSNHFRRELLETLGGWDPFNVTEDADLGVRLHKQGYKTAVIDSTTYEEANSDVHNWIRQRSRWVKGYIQTWLVHMRHPVQLWRALGPSAFVGFNLAIGGTFLCFLLNPLYWALTLLWLPTHWGFIEQIFPSLIFYLGAMNLFLANFTFIYLNVIGAMRRRFYDLIKYALVSPLYWVLISVGAWKGFIQLFTKPFYWEKTVHGLDQGAHGGDNV